MFGHRLPHHFDGKLHHRSRIERLFASFAHHTALPTIRSPSGTRNSPLISFGNNAFRNAASLGAVVHQDGDLEALD